MIQRINVFLLTLIFAFAPAYVYATAANPAIFGGWNIGDVTARAGQATINASKQIGGQVVKSYAVVAPTAQALARGIVKFGAVAAVTTAIDYLLDGVDWVLDPANNRVKYFIPGGSLYYTTFADIDPAKTYTTLDLLCRAALSAAKVKYAQFNPVSYQTSATYCRVYYESGGYDTVPFGTIEGGQQQEASLPYDTVAAEIARKAAAGDAAANEFVADVANPNNWDETGENAYPVPTTPIRDQLDNNAGTQAPPTDDTAPTEPVDPTAPTEPAPPLPFSLPGFCSWAAFICNAMNISNKNSEKVATQSTRIATEAESIKTATQTTAIEAEATKKEVKTAAEQAKADAEAQKKETEKTNTKLDEALANPTQQSDTDFDFPTPTATANTQISFGSNCPAPYTLVDSNWLGIPIRWQIDFSKFCWGMTTFVKPVVIAMASFQAVRIVTGQNDNG